MSPATEPLTVAPTRGGILSRVEAAALCGVAVWFTAVLGLIIVTR